MKSLCDERVIKIIDGMICIDFLNEQLAEFEDVSKTNSENARSGWEKRRANAVAKRSQSERNASREEEKRGEEKREERTTADAVPFEGDVLNSWNDWVKFRSEIKKKLTPTSIQQQIKFLTKGGRAGPEIIAIISKSIQNGWQGLFELNDNDRKFTKSPEPARAPTYERKSGFGKL